MHHYDIAAKVLIEACKNELIERFIGIRVKGSHLTELLPQETVSLKRSDYPILVTDINDIIRLVIIEIQTYWNRKVPLHLLDYRTRYLIEHDVEAISCVILLRPSATAAEIYQDNEVRFDYHLIKIFEMDAQEIIRTGPLCLMPFVPLMKHGEKLVGDADALIYQSEIPRERKADMLTSMAILSGLISENMPSELIKRRKDIMIESAAYEIIKQDGFREGMMQGLDQGLQQGLDQGLQQGIRQSIKRLLLNGFKPDEVVKLLEVDKKTVMQISKQISRKTH